MRRMAERALLDRQAAVLHGLNLGADRDHRVAEAVEFDAGFGFGRLDHQRSGHRKAHRRGVKAVLDQPLRYVVDGNPRTVLPWELVERCEERRVGTEWVSTCRYHG